ncbi:hypothetical protein ABMA58_01520, partial [Oceanospirillum sp. HFRX-1_2]
VGDRHQKKQTTTEKQNKKRPDIFTKQRHSGSVMKGTKAFKSKALDNSETRCYKLTGVRAYRPASRTE